MKKNYLKILICFAAMIGVFLASAVSSYGCWFWSMHQRECPKALIMED
jgi:cyclic lactone autoinducer peptide